MALSEAELVANLKRAGFGGIAITRLLPIIAAERERAVKDALASIARECDRHAEFCKREADKGGNREHMMARYAEANYLAQFTRRSLAALGKENSTAT